MSYITSILFAVIWNFWLIVVIIYLRCVIVGCLILVEMLPETWAYVHFYLNLFWGFESSSWWHWSAWWFVISLLIRLAWNCRYHPFILPHRWNLLVPLWHHHRLISKLLLLHPNHLITLSLPLNISAFGMTSKSLIRPLYIVGVIIIFDCSPNSYDIAMNDIYWIFDLVVFVIIWNFICIELVLQIVSLFIWYIYLSISMLMLSLSPMNRRIYQFSSWFRGRKYWLHIIWRWLISI